MADWLDSTDQPVSAWIALRLSRAEEDEERKARQEGRDPPDILAEHRAILLRLAEQHHLPIPPDHIFADLESGEYLAQRPAFLDLLRLFRRLPSPHSQERRYLLCMAVDRLSRGIPSERAYVQETLDKAGILVLTPHSLTDLSDPDQALLYELRGSLSRHELQRYKQRVRDTLDSQVRRGHPLSGASVFGYVWDKNQEVLVPHPIQFPILQALCRDALLLSCERLAEKYELSTRTVTNVLRNPKICGWPSLRHWKRFDPEKGRKVGHVLPRDQWQMPERAGNYPAACTRAHWEAIQIAMDRRARSRDRYGITNAWCRDVVRFPQAPGPVSLGAWGYRDVKVATYERSQWGGLRLYYPRQEIHQAAQDALCATLEDPVAFRASLSAYVATRTENGVETASESVVAGLVKELERKRKQRQDLLERETAAEDPEERADIAVVRARIRSEIARLSTEMQQAQSAPEIVPELDEMAEELAQMAPELPAQWEETPEYQKRRIINAVIDAIEVVVDCEPGKRRYGREILAVRLRSPFRGIV